MKPRISGIVLTKNEGDVIARCVRSLSWCDEVLLIDDFSTDETLAVAKKTRRDVRIIKRHMNGDFAAQRNAALQKATGEWIVYVDADEHVPVKTGKEIQKEIAQAKTSGVSALTLRRLDYFLGKWLSYGETAHTTFVRVGKKNAGVWKGNVHEVWEVRGETRRLLHPILHEPHDSVSSFVNKINMYTDLVVAGWKKEGKTVYWWDVVTYPVGKFFYNYIVRLGFLDDTAGLLLAVFMGFHSFLCRAKYLTGYVSSETNFSDSHLT